MKKLLLLSFLIILLLINLISETEFSGYYENRFFLIFNTGNNGLSDNKILTGDYNRLRLKLKATPSDKVKINLAVDFFSIYGSLMTPAGVNDNSSIDQINPNEQIDLDRIYVDMYFKHFDLSVGKQRIAMGVSYLWAPLDIFNRINFLEPKEEKPGVNALKLYAPLGKNKSLTAVFLPDEDIGSSGKALRFNWTFFNIDSGITYISGYQIYKDVFGLDLRGENFIGWWIEYGYFKTFSETYSKFVLGVDYTFPIGSGLYWLSEYFYDNSGEVDFNNYDYDLVINGDRFTLGRKYLFSMLRYGVSDFASLSISYIGNIDDGSFLINPAFSYELFQNVSITSGFYIPMGKSGRELNNKNIGAFFLWLKINF
ncbi:MAG: hypothetical protein KAS97_13450 [Candidatus Aminicenantes bacterium]|nr:hypothetical protein [Candidatus Aminicenantes bacterium]